jgi:hypothetical protein
MHGPVTADTVFEPVPYWAKVPHGLWLREATSVAVDSEDRVYVFNRGNMPVLVFDHDGKLIHMWGNDTPHAGMTDYYARISIARFTTPAVRPSSMAVPPQFGHDCIAMPMFVQW